MINKTITPLVFCYLDQEGPHEKDRRHVYSLTTTVHEGIHFGMVTVLQHPRQYDEGGVDTDRRHEKDVIDLYLAITRDGVNWDLSRIYKGVPLIERGGHGAFDNDQIIPAPSFVTWNNAHYIYYRGINERHDCESPSKTGVAMGIRSHPTSDPTIHTN